MKFCYADESGYGEGDILVIAGVIVDASRSHVTRSDWTQLLHRLSELAGNEVREFKSRDFYRGRGQWATVDGPERSDIINYLIDWLEQRKHRVAFSAVDKASFARLQEHDARLQELKSEWCTAAFHLLLSLQKAHQSQKQPKGHTVVVFDREFKEELAIAALAHRPPPWSDVYYLRDGNRDPLDHIVDVPYFADSAHILLSQLADLVAYLLRTFADLAHGHLKPKYAQEPERIANWAERVGALALPRASRYPQRARDSCAELFWSLAPEALRSLGA
jgi:hypothetical protein